MMLCARLAFEWRVVDRALLGQSTLAEIEARSELSSRLRVNIQYPDIPSVFELHLPVSTPTDVDIPPCASPGLASPLIEEARVRSLVSDFKPLSDLVSRDIDEREFESWASRFEMLGGLAGNDAENARNHLVRQYIESVYQPELMLADASGELFAPRMQVVCSDASIKRAFDYIEGLWPRLCKVSGSNGSGSLLPTPYPFLIPAGRFTETYYWDTGFGIEGLIKSGRLNLAQMQAENMLEQIRRYGFVPNGNRDYYLSRSQPPLSSIVVRLVAEATERLATESGDQRLIDRLHNWLSLRAIPLLAREFELFWSDESRRFDRERGLHHHWDELDATRPERYSTDDENSLGKSLRDVRAMAESGLDFTEIYNGASGLNEITNYAPVLLNALLAGFAGNIAWLCERCGLISEQHRFNTLAAQRRSSIDRYLWDDDVGHYRSLNLATGELSRGLDFTTFAPLYVGIASPEQAKAVHQSAAALLKSGGLASSNVAPAIHQWDGGNGWAPAQIMAVGGLLRYGLESEAKDLAGRWVGALVAVFEKYGGFYERIDVERCDLPARAEHQYPVQEGFLWTNASFVWMLNEVLGVELASAA